MADVTLSDGREIEFDLSKLTIKEYRSLFDPSQPEEDEYGILGRVSGLSAEEIEELPLLEWKRFYGGFLKKAREPLADPN